MDDAKTFLLKINAYTPETIPMNRLAEYMKQFAVVLGEAANVHFERVAPGSAILRARVEYEAIPKVNYRVRQVATSVAPADAMTAVAALNTMLANDNTNGSIARLDQSQEEEMIFLPGATIEKEPVFGPVSQPTTLDGVVIRVGGRKAEVPVHIETRDGVESHCMATRELAKQFGKFLFTAELRFFGDGKWIRNEAGNWILQRLDISRFEVLSAATLGEAVADLRSIEGRDWNTDEARRDLSELHSDKDE